MFRFSWTVCMLPLWTPPPQQCHTTPSRPFPSDQCTTSLPTSRTLFLPPSEISSGPCRNTRNSTQFYGDINSSHSSPWVSMSMYIVKVSNRSEADGGDWGGGGGERAWFICTPYESMRVVTKIFFFACSWKFSRKIAWENIYYNFFSKMWNNYIIFIKKFNKLIKDILAGFRGLLFSHYLLFFLWFLWDMCRTGTN